MNSVEEYAKRWAKHKKKDIDTFSDGLLNVFDACKISH